MAFNASLTELMANNWSESTGATTWFRDGLLGHDVIV